MEKLLNKSVIITGAASGMGRAMAILFAKEGADLMLVDLHQNELDELKKQTANPAKVQTFVCDMAKDTEVKAMFDAVVNSRHRVDIVINNAGIMDDFMPVDKLTNEQWNRVMGVNINGPFYLCRLAVAKMLEQQSGVIVNVASIGGLMGARAGAAYTSSKHALIGLTKNIGFMYAKQGIRCNAIAPGGVNTGIGKNMHPEPFGYERCTSGGASMPRMGEAEEIAETALFLASEAASFINGAIITADAGWTAY
jgi:NAD(P)-dependent dehydrogenase (short-subunit alcohol dehydrogenase family)